MTSSGSMDGWLEDRAERSSLQIGNAFTRSGGYTKDPSMKRNRAKAKLARLHQEPCHMTGSSIVGAGAGTSASTTNNSRIVAPSQIREWSSSRSNQRHHQGATKNCSSTTFAGVEDGTYVQDAGALGFEAAGPERDLLEEINIAGRLEGGVARFYLGQLLDTIDLYHSRGFCHRDIKPANILLDRQGNVKLKECVHLRSKAALPRMAPLTGMFDSAVAGSGRVIVHAPRDAPEHAAPEVLQGFAYDGKAADVWSLGMGLSTMLTGVPPFTADEATSFHCGLQVPPNFMRPSAHSLVECMMKSDPKKRYTTTQVRSHPWFTQTRAVRSRSPGGSVSDDGGGNGGGSCGGGRSESSSSRDSSTSPCSSISGTSSNGISSRSSAYSSGSGRDSVDADDSV